METGAKNEKKSVSLFRVGRLYSILTRKKKNYKFDDMTKKKYEIRR